MNDFESQPNNPHSGGTDHFGMSDGSGALAPACERALEAWICEDPASVAAQNHIEKCASCRELAEAIRLDQDLLRWQLERLQPPPTPRLELRDPLQSASGHPRRVSLTVLPYLLGVLLVVVLASLYLGGSMLNRWAPLWETEKLLRSVDVAANATLAAPAHSSATPPAGWESQIDPALPKSVDGGSPLLDRYGTPIQLRAEPSSAGEWRWRARSAGPDRTFDTGDDILAPKPSAPHP